MTNFEFWTHEIADMPQRTPNGNGWVDLETGLRYDPAFNYSGAAPRARVSRNALDARLVAKQFGGKALTGSAKQKEWGEKIRAAALAGMADDQAALICACASVTGSAKFWIETRVESAPKIVAFLENLIAAVKVANTASRAGKPVDKEAIAKIKRAQAGDMGALQC